MYSICQVEQILNQHDKGLIIQLFVRNTHDGFACTLVLPSNVSLCWAHMIGVALLVQGSNDAWKYTSAPIIA